MRLGYANRDPRGVRRHVGRRPRDRRPKRPDNVDPALVLVGTNDAFAPRAHPDRPIVSDANTTLSRDLVADSSRCRQGDVDADPRCVAQGMTCSSAWEALLLFFVRRTGEAEIALDLWAEPFAQAIESRRRVRAAHREAPWLEARTGYPTGSERARDY
jgi:hypothetical protein